ncbi:hypothetical protein ASPZODRAFT_1673696 [Penicilliopsis zonata CBS 506.65]|uniref:Uncharacterized protein n=1 Tax=Penicilliopsis zonata CBS 506.65 TaxID=1073090 RepID=A0A1L9SJU1_9EURO|nr:hypothetical protein ASPZODRAFT_1673696 [Penicilliopsis zonata CBS 506.65]OJJ47437.1 hypothetical protein ASPZODRAFT_1673696 [Penicilliopsis zonata CBS 506.65]
MGNFLSAPVEERRRSIRISKPLTNPFTQCMQNTGSEDILPMMLKSTTTTANFRASVTPPNVSPSLHDPQFKVQFRPSENRSEDADSPVEEKSPLEAIHERVGDIPSFSSRVCKPSSRRSSFQASSSRSSSISIDYQRPKRSLSTRSTSHMVNAVLHESELEHATSSNTYFMVDNQRFSLTRRRSLLTRPSTGPRRPRDRLRRAYSSADHELESPSESPIEAFDTSQWPLLSPRDADLRYTFSTPRSTRPSTPTEFEYTHLGQLKLGSLRVVNVSTSPCSSDRTLMTKSDGKGVLKAKKDSDGRQGVGNYKEQNVDFRHIKVSAPTLQIPDAACKDREVDGFPGSPFSFDKSPIVPVTLSCISPCSSEPEDEGIHVPNSRHSLDTISESHTKSESSDGVPEAPRSPDKVDSGYSSANSVRSLEESDYQSTAEFPFSNQDASQELEAPPEDPPGETQESCTAQMGTCIPQNSTFWESPLARIESLCIADVAL